MANIEQLDLSHFRRQIRSYHATNSHFRRYRFMTSQKNTAREGLTTQPHYVALPYRADGVARALRETYPAIDETIPPDMIALLTAIDQLLALNARR